MFYPPTPTRRALGQGWREHRPQAIGTCAANPPTSLQSRHLVAPTLQTGKLRVKEMD